MVKILDRRKHAMGGHSKRAISRIKNIAIHYSATTSGNTIAFERHWKNVRKWSTGGYHEVVLLNGDVELNYNADVISNGVGGLNTQMYNICYVGTGSPNTEQMASLIDRVNYNRKRFKLSVNSVKGHREYAGQSTSCPGLNMTNFRKELTNTGGLSMTQYNELKKLINNLTNKVNDIEKENKALKTQINKKQNKYSDNQYPDASHKQAWEKAEKSGIFNGRNPHYPITRAQASTVLDRLNLLD